MPLGLLPPPRAAEPPSTNTTTTMGKKDGADNSRGLADVEVYFNQIRSVIKHYKRIVEKLEAIKNDKKSALEKIDLIVRGAGRAAVTRHTHLDTDFHFSRWRG